MKKKSPDARPTSADKTRIQGENASGGHAWPFQKREEHTRLEQDKQHRCSDPNGGVIRNEIGNKSTENRPHEAPKQRRQDITYPDPSRRTGTHRFTS